MNLIINKYVHILEVKFGLKGSKSYLLDLSPDAFKYKDNYLC
jgi:hypothetical protein